MGIGTRLAVYQPEAGNLPARVCKRTSTMSHTHEDHDYEVIGVGASIAMVAGGLLVAISPALMQLYLLIAN